MNASCSLTLCLRNRLAARLLESVLLAGLILRGGLAWGASYTIADLGTLGGSASSAYGLNDAGSVVGDSLPSGGLPELAFRYENGVMKNLGTLAGATGSRANGLNAEGTIVGHANFTEGGRVQRAYVVRDGQMTDLATLGGPNSSAYAINAADWIVGSAELSSGGTRAFLHHSGMATNLGTLGGDFSSAYGLNDDGIVVGEAENAAGFKRAFRFDGSMVDLGTLGGNLSAAYGINAQGLIVGSASTASGPRHAFRYDGTMQDLGTLGGPSSGANGVNSAGIIVGVSTSVLGTDQVAFVYDGSMKNLNSLIPSESGWTLNFATAINDQGQIVGVGQFNGERRAFLLTPKVDSTFTVTYSVKADGTMTLTSDGFLQASFDLAGPYAELGVKTLTVDPSTTSGNRFFQARSE